MFLTWNSWLLLGFRYWQSAKTPLFNSLKFKKMYKILVFVSLAFLSFCSSCQEDEMMLCENQDGVLVVDSEGVRVCSHIPVVSDDCVSCAFSDLLNLNKSVAYGNYEFQDGGVVGINGVLLPTTVIGNQRWTTLNYSSATNGLGTYTPDDVVGHNIDGAVVFFFNWKFASSFSNVPQTMEFYAPAGLRAVSGWRIPSRADAAALYSHVAGTSSQKNAKIQKGLRLDAPTGILRETLAPVIEPDGSTKRSEMQLVRFQPSYSVFWLSDVTKTSYTTIHNFAGMNGGGDYVTTQASMPPLFATIRLVQDVVPLD